MEELRPLLITYAYNIIGTYEDAKDIVQDAFIKFINTDSDKIENKRAYLIRTVINLSINFKNRQKKLIAQYPGQWLPEPIATDHADEILDRKEILSYSLMVLLEKLNARQRAVFILKEAFDYDHEEIADLLSTSVENSRKLLSRARSQLQSKLPGTSQNIPVDYLNKFLHILQTGDRLELEKLLIDDITVTSDGGGKAVAFMNMITGRKDVMHLLAGLFRKFYNNARIETGSVNHQPALFYFENDNLVTCQILAIENGRITNIFFMRNPDKLKILQKVY
jgi:RNA polymerase sigma-70 factor (ECF subfamily)